MIDLLLGIFFFAIILVFFKLFEKYKVDNLQAIIINYAVAGGLGLLMCEGDLTGARIFESDWILYAVLIGIFFISVFKLLADGAQKVGLAISTVANKMSVILPVIASILLYGDSVTAFKIGGIAVALVGVYLSSSTKGKLSFDRNYLWLIIVIFLGQGIADILFNYAQETHVQNNDASLFISTIFLAAFILGSIILAIRIGQKKEAFKVKNIGWGVALGIPNYLTVFFFFRSLENGFMESSQIYPILNMGIIILSAFIGLLFFKEKLSATNWIGITCCLVSIFLISFENVIMSALGF